MKPSVVQMGRGKGKKKVKGIALNPQDWFDPAIHMQAQLQQLQEERARLQEIERKLDSVSEGFTNPLTSATHKLAFCSGGLMRKTGAYHYVFYHTGNKGGIDGGNSYDVYLLSDHRNVNQKAFDVGTVHMHPLSDREDYWALTEQQYDEIMQVMYGSKPPAELLQQANVLDKDL